MKIKTIVISAVLVVGAGAVTSYFVRRQAENNVVMVEVAPVTSLNSVSYGLGDSSTVSGTIISRDTQVVSLDTSHELIGVYVEQGDRVKRGDKLLEYDMIGDELKAEMEELTKLGLELRLEAQKKDLATLKSGRMPTSSSDDDDSDFEVSVGDDDDDDDDDRNSALRTNSDGRSTGSVSRQGTGKVGAKDPFGDPLAGPYSHSASGSSAGSGSVSSAGSGSASSAGSKSSSGSGSGSASSAGSKSSSGSGSVSSMSSGSGSSAGARPVSSARSLPGVSSGFLSGSSAGSFSGTLAGPFVKLSVNLPESDVLAPVYSETILVYPDEMKEQLTDGNSLPESTSSDMEAEEVIDSASADAEDNTDSADAEDSVDSADSTTDGNRVFFVDNWLFMELFRAELINENYRPVEGLFDEDGSINNAMLPEGLSTSMLRNAFDFDTDEELTDAETAKRPMDAIPVEGETPGAGSPSSQADSAALASQFLDSDTDAGNEQVTDNEDGNTDPDAEPAALAGQFKENEKTDDKTEDTDIKDAGEGAPADSAALAGDLVGKEQGANPQSTKPGLRTRMTAQVPVTGKFENEEQVLDEEQSKKEGEQDEEEDGEKKSEGLIEEEEIDEDLPDEKENNSKAIRKGGNDNVKGLIEDEEENDDQPEDKEGKGETPEINGEKNDGKLIEDKDENAGEPKDNDIEKEEEKEDNKDENIDKEKTEEQEEGQDEEGKEGSGSSSTSPSTKEENDTTNADNTNNVKMGQEQPLGLQLSANQKSLSDSLQNTFDTLNNPPKVMATQDEIIPDQTVDPPDKETDQTTSEEPQTTSEEPQTSPETSSTDPPVVDNPSEIIEDAGNSNPSETVPDTTNNESPAIPPVIDDTYDTYDPGYTYNPGYTYTAPMELETNFYGERYIDEDEDDTPIEDIISEVNAFLTEVNNISLAIGDDWNAVPSQMPAIEAAMQKFRDSFGEPYQFEKIDMFGDTITVTAYDVKQDITRVVGNATASILQSAYDKLAVYHFVNTMLTLNPGMTPTSVLDPAWATANEAALRSAITEFAALPDSVLIYNPVTGTMEFSSEFGSLNGGIFSGEPFIDFLKNALIPVNYNYVVGEPEIPIDTPSTEGERLPDNYDDDDYGNGYTMEELQEAIREQEKAIKETELQIREAELAIKEYKQILDGRIVYATINGIVKSAGSVDTSSGSNAFITITGKEGLYVKGSVNELALDTIKVGDVITGTSYETGSTFAAEIVEISEYPDTGNNNYYGYGEENANSSYYPFLAYIENADGLSVDSYVDLSLDGNAVSSSGDPYSRGLSLDEYMIRTDASGRSFCYVRGKDGLLEKRYLEIGANNWGVITVKSGLAQNDFIAFPYGKGVEDGAQTVEVEYLTAIDGISY